MILSSQEGQYVLVHTRVVDTIARWVDERHDFLEAGGILIGSYRGPHIEIVDCTTPMLFDRRRRTLFDRRDPGHQLAAMNACLMNMFIIKRFQCLLTVLPECII